MTELERQAIANVGEAVRAAKETLLEIVAALERSTGIHPMCPTLRAKQIHDLVGHVGVHVRPDQLESLIRYRAIAACLMQEVARANVVVDAMSWDRLREDRCADLRRLARRAQYRGRQLDEALNVFVRLRRQRREREEPRQDTDVATRAMDGTGDRVANN